MSVVSCLSIYILENIKLQMAYRICYSKKLKFVWGAVVAAGIPIVAGALEKGVLASNKYIVTYISVFLVTLFRMHGKWQHRVIDLLEMLFLLLCMDGAGDMLEKLISMHWLTDYELEKCGTIIGKLITTFILGIIMMVKDRGSRAESVIGKKVVNNIHYLVVIMVVNMLLVIATMDVTIGYLQNSTLTIWTTILCGGAYIGVAALGYFVIYIKKINKRMDDMLHRERQLSNMQQFYYENLLESEVETRKYRHDIINHIICLDGLVASGNLERVSTYLKEMQTQVVDIQKKSYTTGSKIIDIITNYQLGMLEDDVMVHVIGKLQNEINIDDMVLCTIYANLLENAREELAKKGEDKFLKIHLLQGEEYFQITIQNSLSPESRQKTELLRTHKTDKKNHGIGLKNVKNAVENCGGSLKFTVEKECFTACVILQNK